MFNVKFCISFKLLIQFKLMSPPTKWNITIQNIKIKFHPYFSIPIFFYYGYEKNVQGQHKCDVLYLYTHICSISLLPNAIKIQYRIILITGMTSSQMEFIFIYHIKNIFMVGIAIRKRYNFYEVFINNLFQLEYDPIQV